MVKFNKENEMKENDSLYVGVKHRENRFLRNVYLWMFIGLALTGLVSFAVAQSRTLLRMVATNPAVLFIIVIAEFATVFILAGRIERLSTAGAIGCFLFYSALTGFTLSSIVAAYAGSGIITKAFVSSAVVFAIAALYATFSKKDVSRWYSFLIIGLIGLIVASLLNFIFRSTVLEFGISLLGVLIFTGLTIFDTRKILAINSRYGDEMTSEEFHKISILGALDLYLDFLNIFLYLVRIFGNASSSRR